jgi:hypothetical protein
VIAAFGAPERAEPFDRHDPREARALDAFATPEALRSRLAASGAAWLVAPRDREAVAIQCGTIAARNDEFELLRVARTAR